MEQMEVKDPPNRKQLDKNRVFCCNVFLPIVLVVLQVIGGIVWIMIWRTETIILGVVSIAMTALFIVANFIKKYRSLLHIIHLGYIGWYFAAGLSLLIIWFVSLYERCVLYEDLSQRIAPELTTYQSCGMHTAIMVLMWIGIALFIWVNIHLGSVGYKFYSKESAKERVQEWPFSSLYDNNSEEEEDMNIVYNVPLSPQSIRNRLLLLGLGTAVGVVVLLSVLFLILLPGQVNLQTDGQCPAGHDAFLPFPEQNDLDCCDWHENATCCHRSVCKAGNKPPSPVIKNNECNKLLGLLNCAPCRNDSGNFLEDPSDLSDPWTEGKLSVCPSFCAQLFNSCQPSMTPLDSFCAFGSDCKFARDGYSNVYHSGDDIQFCHDFGLGVRGTDCFSLASTFTLNFKLLLLSLSIAFIWTCTY